MIKINQSDSIDIIRIFDATHCSIAHDCLNAEPMKNSLHFIFNFALVHTSRLLFIINSSNVENAATQNDSAVRI